MITPAEPAPPDSALALRVTDPLPPDPYPVAAFAATFVPTLSPPVPRGDDPPAPARVPNEKVPAKLGFDPAVSEMFAPVAAEALAGKPNMVLLLAVVNDVCPPLPPGHTNSVPNEVEPPFPPFAPAEAVPPAPIVTV